MITGRLVLVSLVVGVVLAVGSVVVAAVSWEASGHVKRSPDLAVCFQREGHGVLVTRYDSVGATTWNSVSAPGVDHPTLRYFVRRDEAMPVESDPRPHGLWTPLDDRVRIIVSFRFGWPFRGARYVDRNTANPHVSRTSGRLLVAGRGRDWSIPYLPLWPGLLGNTLFYAVPVFTTIVLWRWRRLRRRAKRGMCLACAYDLGVGVMTCPECGLTMPSTA